MMDDGKVENWSIVGLAVFAFLIGVVQGMQTDEPKMTWLCLLGIILAIDIGVVQIHIREAV